MHWRGVPAPTKRHSLAREMHDLFGHSLTVTLLHLGSARLAHDDDLDARTGPSGTRPTATDFADLVDSYRKAGAAIDLEVPREVVVAPFLISPPLPSERSRRRRQPGCSGSAGRPQADPDRAILLDRLVAQLLGGEHRAHLDPGRGAVGRERQDRRGSVRVAAGLTVEQRDPLRRGPSIRPREASGQGADHHRRRDEVQPGDGESAESVPVARRRATSPVSLIAVVRQALRQPERREPVVVEGDDLGDCLPTTRRIGSRSVAVKHRPPGGRRGPWGCTRAAGSGRRTCGSRRVREKDPGSRRRFAASP